MAHYLYIGLSEDGRVAKIGRTECPRARLYGINSQCRKNFGIDMRGIALWQIRAENLFQAQVAEEFLREIFRADSIGHTEWLLATPRLIQIARHIGIDPQYSQRKRRSFRRKQR